MTFSQKPEARDNRLRRLYFFAQPNIIWVLFAITLVLTLCFGLVMQIWQFQIIDEMFQADKIAAHIDGFSDTQRRVHIWVTATLDVAYPFAYALLFIGLILRAFPVEGRWLILPSLLVVPIDLAEGFSQIQLLLGDSSYMWLKVSMTPIKLALFVIGLIIALTAFAKIVRSRKSRNAK